MLGKVHLSLLLVFVSGSINRSTVPLHHQKYDIVVGLPMMEVNSMGGSIRTMPEPFKENWREFYRNVSIGLCE
jgi:hypothetical protein